MKPGLGKTLVGLTLLLTLAGDGMAIKKMTEHKPMASLGYLVGATAIGCFVGGFAEIAYGKRENYNKKSNNKIFYQ